MIGLEDAGEEFGFELLPVCNPWDQGVILALPANGKRRARQTGRPGPSGSGHFLLFGAKLVCKPVK